MLASKKSLPVNWIWIHPPSLSNLIQNDICMSANSFLQRSRTGLVFNAQTEIQNEPESSHHSVLSRSGYPFDPGWREGSGETSENRIDSHRT